jgi:hypothetical protein
MKRMVISRQLTPLISVRISSQVSAGTSLFRKNKKTKLDSSREKNMKTSILLIEVVVAALCVVANNVSAQGSAGGATGAASNAGGTVGAVGGTAGAGLPVGGGFGRGVGTPAGSQASVAVTAVADDRANALVVKATDETLKQIQDLVKQLDCSVGEDVVCKVFRLTNADPTEIASQIATLFDTSSTASGGQGQMGAFTGSSDRLTRMATVTTLPDPRTGALIVAATSHLMPKIEGLILQLDSDPGYKETVGFFELQNADVQDAYAILSDLFNRTSVRMQGSANNNPLLGANNPLTQRLNSLSSSTSSSFGTSSSSGTTSGRTGTASTGF